MTEFKQFHRTSGRRVQNPNPVLTVGTDGKFQLNIAAWALLNEPRAVQLFFAEGDDLIGIRPVTEGNPDAYAVVNADKANYKKVISATSFCAHYKIDTEETSQYTVTLDEGQGMAIINLHEPLVYGD
jgi:hypothetical protein